jgi:hypothetical protein
MSVGVGDLRRLAGEFFGVSEHCQICQIEPRFFETSLSEGASRLMELGSLRPQEVRMGGRSVVAIEDCRDVGRDHFALSAGEGGVWSEMDLAER